MTEQDAMVLQALDVTATGCLLDLCSAEEAIEHMEQTLAALKEDLANA